MSDPSHARATASDTADGPTPRPRLRPGHPPPVDLVPLDESSGDWSANLHALLTDPGPLPAVPGYAVERELGRGGMGVVYLARQAGIDRPVALKMLRADGPADPGVCDRFVDEARIAARLRHPHIAQVYEFGRADGQPYFALEYVDGPTLGRYAAGRPLPPAEAAGLIEKVAGAIGYAHGFGIVHRDLKPSNVLIRLPRDPDAPDPVPLVTDFGLAKLLGRSGVHTATGVAAGTPGYMAPEQVLGDRDKLGPWTDVWALGVMLYELLTGRLPYRVDNPDALLLAPVTSPPVPARDRRKQVPRDLETVCMTCLEKDPARRYPTADALAADLRRFRTGEPVRARRPGVAERARRLACRHPLRAAVLAAVAGTMVGGAVVGGWADHQRRAAAAALAEVTADRDRLAADLAARR